MRIALAHDSFTQLGGAERVVEAMHEMFPDAPVFTLCLDRNLKDKYHGWDIRTSWLQVLYNFIPKLQYLLPLIPLAVYSLKFDDYDVVISSSSSWIKNIHVPQNCIHIDYCHTPTRFLWTDAEYFDQEVPKILQPIAKPVINWMKKWDYKGAQRVSHFIANSKEVQKRIKQYYNRDSEVIYPFVDTDFWKPVLSSFQRHSGAIEGQLESAEESQTKEKEILRSAQDDAIEKSDYFLVAGRLQAHKHNDLIVEIFNELGLPLRVVGVGRQKIYLESIAKDNIKFLGRVTDEELRKEFSGAKGLISPQLEDFGLIPLEAAACGTATLGLAAGGNLETIVPGVTGELFGQDHPVIARPIDVQLGPAEAILNQEKVASPLNQSPKRLAMTSKDKESLKEETKEMILSWDPQRYSIETLRSHAAKFSKEKFKQQILEFINLNKIRGRE